MSGAFDYYEEEPPKQWLGGSFYKSESEFGYECYHKRGTNYLYHNACGPARYWYDLFGHYYEYQVNGNMHRDDGPAVLCDVSGYLEHPNLGVMGNIEYYLKRSGQCSMQWWWQGEKYDFNEWVKMTALSDKEQAVLLLKWG